MKSTVICTFLALAAQTVYSTPLNRRTLGLLEKKIALDKQLIDTVLSFNPYQSRNTNTNTNINTNINNNVNINNINTSNNFESSETTNIGSSSAGSNACQGCAGNIDALVDSGDYSECQRHACSANTGSVSAKRATGKVSATGTAVNGGKSTSSAKRTTGKVNTTSPARNGGKSRSPSTAGSVAKAGSTKQFSYDH
ncbi:hypothetical protein DSO57_1034751 [Entomophthora muscae]|uniref:Uncharacterized protein n=2 Tax=Entomophthora muscae TaxID=34485 RepID=A0ACC2UKC3_9FUNG|nr:hypothetical protein DSO57_1034749 [Entomophthora muscae]KAJ9087275.1 hypothetical protein DSO57_1034751 [Entomophthora muscae]